MGECEKPVGTCSWWCSTDTAGSQVSQHLLNSAYALFEVLLTRTSPPPPLHLLFLIIILALYLALAYISKATEGFYVYNFLDPATGAGHVAGYCIGIFVAACVIFGIVWVVIWARHKATRNLAKYSHERSEKPHESMGEVHGEMIELGQEAK